MMEILAPILDDIIEVKNDRGDAIIPPFGIYDPDFTDWEVKEAYKVKMLNAADLELCGQKVDPANTPISLQTGVQWIAYLRDNNSPPATEMASASSCILWMKNDDGDAYLPALIPPGNMDEMVPTEGYKLKASCDATVQYTQNVGGAVSDKSTGYVPGKRHEVKSDQLWHFTKGINSGLDATLVIPANAVGEHLQPGDEIGAFSEDGTPCGAARFEGQNFYLTLWGDDPATAEKEGLADQEPYVLWKWNALTTEVTTLPFTLQLGEALFSEDAFQVLDQMGSPTATEDATSQLLWHMYPNPASDKLLLAFSGGNVENGAQLEIINLDGKSVTTTILQPGQLSAFISLREIPSGLYWCKMQTGEMISIKKLMIVK